MIIIILLLHYVTLQFLYFCLSFSVSFPLVFFLALFLYSDPAPLFLLSLFFDSDFATQQNQETDRINLSFPFFVPDNTIHATSTDNVCLLTFSNYSTRVTFFFKGIRALCPYIMVMADLSFTSHCKRVVRKE